MDLGMEELSNRDPRHSAATGNDRRTVVTRQATLEFVDPVGDNGSLDADFVYDPADPFAVTTVFKTAAGPVAWTFARDLILEGVYEPTGDGDVHVWPCLSSDGTAVVVIELCSPDGEVLVQAPAREVNRFAQEILDMVPLGDECAYVDVDAELAALIA